MLLRHILFKHVSAVLGQDDWGKLSQQGRQEGDLAEKGGEWIALVLALVSPQICLLFQRWGKKDLLLIVVKLFTI